MLRSSDMGCILLVYVPLPTFIVAVLLLFYSRDGLKMWPASRIIFAVCPTDWPDIQVYEVITNNVSNYIKVLVRIAHIIWKSHFIWRCSMGTNDRFYHRNETEPAYSLHHTWKILQHFVLLIIMTVHIINFTQERMIICTLHQISSRR
jgi:hypothetical protein